jgi:hypothetical protein
MLALGTSTLTTRNHRDLAANHNGPKFLLLPALRNHRIQECKVVKSLTRESVGKSSEEKVKAIKSPHLTWGEHLFLLWISLNLAGSTPPCLPCK